MFDTARINAELAALKTDVSRLLGAVGDEAIHASKEQADSLAEHLKATMAELGEAVGDERDQLESLVAERPIAALAAAFAVGMVVGLVMRRR